MFTEPENRTISPLTVDTRPTAIIIGSGFGGLAAAIRLGAKGYRVTICEHLDKPGGRAYVYKQDGFTFDAGPTIITAPFLIDELWELCGKKREDHVELVRLDPFYRLVFDDGSTFLCTPDHEEMCAEVARLSPDDVAGYDAYMNVSKDMYDTGFEGLSEKPFTSPLDMVGILPQLARLRADRSVYHLASKHLKDERLRLAMSFHPLFVGGNPMTATSFYSMISHLEREGGVNFAMGGTGSLVAGMVDLIEGQGGKLRFNATVKEILLENGAAVGVELESGERIAADLVVSNADTATTYRRMLPENARNRWVDRVLDRSHYSMSLFVWYFGTKKRFEEVDHHTIILGPRYQELLTDIFKNKHLAEDFSLYLHRPTATDPSLAPEGCDAFYALSPVPHLDSGTDWEAHAETYRQKIEQRLHETVLPGLGEEIVSSHMLTPLDFKDRLLSEKGAAFGMEPVLTQMAWFRPHNRSEDIDNLYFVGAGTHPGAGVPGVLCSAKVMDQLVPSAAEIRR